MALDPQVRHIIESLPERGLTGFADLTAARARAAVAAGIALQGEPEPVAEVHELTVPGPGGPLPARTYRPATAVDVDGPGPADRAALPVLVHFHGGGFVLGDLDLAVRPCRALANATGAVVASVRYRKA
ncbi:MAG: acetyl esterase, partial [Pseudonocardiales bacterium]|nr:acetyl esterase [Pseudonocardiales bacterium]